MDKAQADRQRFDNGLPWYVNGTMDSVERAWMDAYVREHPEARDELLLVQNMADLFSHPEPDPAGDERVIQATLKRAQALQASAKPSGGSLLRWWQRTWAVPTPVFAAVLVALVVPVWWVMHNQESAVGIDIPRSMSIPQTQACSDQWRLRIAFGPDIPFDRAVILLQSVNANIVAGPTATGEFWLRWPTQAERDNAASTLSRVYEVHDVFIPPVDSEMGCLK